MLQSLELNHLGPTPRLAMEFAPRLNLLTSDNGQGKTLLLDEAWGVLTQTWAGDRDGSAIQTLRRAGRE